MSDALGITAVVALALTQVVLVGCAALVVRAAIPFLVPVLRAVSRLPEATARSAERAAVDPRDVERAAARELVDAHAFADAVETEARRIEAMGAGSERAQAEAALAALVTDNQRLIDLARASRNGGPA